MSAIEVLLAEDNHGDIHLIEQTVEERGLPANLHVVRTGRKALDWLYQRGEFTETPRPEFVLLDLNLPVVGGQAVLKEIKSDPGLGRIPVVVLTGSESETDVTEAYGAGANACLRKPVDPTEFADRIQAVVEFWQSAAVLPSVSTDGDTSP